MSKSSISPFSIRYLGLLAFSVGLGLLGGLVTIAFIHALEFVVELIWTDIPEKLSINQDVYIVIAAIVGGILVGLAHKHFGPWPESLEKAFARFKKTGEFDYQHIVVGVIASFAALGFGAALGPEAALIAVVGGTGTWIAKRLSATSDVLRTASQISMSAFLGAMFGSLAGLAVSPEKGKNFSQKLWLYLPGLLAAVIAFLLMKHFGNGGYFEYDFLPYDFKFSDVIYVIPVTLVAAIGGLAFLLSDKAISALADRHAKHPVVVSTTAGVIFGLLATTSSFILFSGHEGIQEIMDQYNDLDGSYLVLIGLAKAFAASMLLAAFWKGGRFFPMMFVGAAIGIGLTKGYTAIDPMVGLATGVGAALAVVVPKPLLVGLLLLLIFPMNLVLFALLGTLLGSLIGKSVETA